MSGRTATSRAQEQPAGPVMGWPRTLARLVEGRNINPETLLATDYLNHFNEIVMLIELVGDMPDCLEDVAEWKPVPYEEHFRRSSFANKELAILAYENAPEIYRRAFDNTIDKLDKAVDHAVAHVSKAVAANDPDTAGIVALYTNALRRLIDVASGIIHGETVVMDQSDIDAILAE